MYLLWVAFVHRFDCIFYTFNFSFISMIQKESYKNNTVNSVDNEKSYNKLENIEHFLYLFPLYGKLYTYYNVLIPVIVKCTVDWKLVISPLSCWNWKCLAFTTSIEPGQSAHPYSLTRLYTVGLPSSSSDLDIPKNDNGQFQKWKVDYSI